MNRLSKEDQIRVVTALVEGNSINAACRITGVAKMTVLKLLSDVGNACQEFQFHALRDLECKNIQCDEIWSFCYAKEKNVPAKFKGEFGYGDVYTWVALCADCKLVPQFFVGRRDPASAQFFMRNLARRLKDRVHLTTDGYNRYPDAVLRAFGLNVDYSQLIKIYNRERDDTDVRYSPPHVVGARKQAVIGDPDLSKTSTSFIERQNLTMRMHMRRYTRLTNGFSKKIDNLMAAVALHFVYYNFCRIHQSLRMTPAMKAGKADRVWDVKDIVDLLYAKSN